VSVAEGKGAEARARAWGMQVRLSLVKQRRPGVGDTGGGTQGVGMEGRGRRAGRMEHGGCGGMEGGWGGAGHTSSCCISVKRPSSKGKRRMFVLVS
jgi:hypothetical protein